jgi:4'-phosphopantetheinyl transferase EntD
MDSQTILQAWHQMLPASVFVSAGPLLEYAVPLTARERASAGCVGERRMRELESGRAYAKRALAMLGIDDVDLPVGLDRSPQWPSGIVGSLTHVRGCVDGHFAAAVARKRDARAVGIDVERENGLHPRLWNLFLTAHELERIIARPVPVRPILAQIAWCAKEAVMKAARRPVEPTEIDIEPDPSGNEFTASWRKPGSDRRSAEVWRGRTARSQGLILAAVIGTAGLASPQGPQHVHATRQSSTFDR